MAKTCIRVKVSCEKICLLHLMMKEMNVALFKRIFFRENIEVYWLTCVLRVNSASNLILHYNRSHIEYLLVCLYPTEKLLTIQRTFKELFSLRQNLFLCTSNRAALWRALYMFLTCLCGSFHHHRWSAEDTETWAGFPPQDCRMITQWSYFTVTVKVWLLEFLQLDTLMCTCR